MSRPIVGKIKSIDIKVRIDSDMNDLLVDYCIKNNVKRAEAIRVAISRLKDK